MRVYQFRHIRAGGQSSPPSRGAESPVLVGALHRLGANQCQMFVRSRPFIDSPAGPISAIGLVSLIGSTGWTHPREGEQLRENVAALESRIRELEAEVSRLHIDHEKVADADRLFANLADNQGIVSRRAEAPSARPL